MTRRLSLLAALIGLLCFLDASHAQQGSAQPRMPGFQPQVWKGPRTIHTLRNANANDLVDLLNLHYREEARISVLPGPGNGLLISAPQVTTDEIIKLLAQLDQPAKMVEIEVILADVTPKKGDDSIDAADPKILAEGGGILTKLEGLKKDGQISAFQRITFNAVEGQPVEIRTGGNKPYVSSRTLTATGAAQRSVSYHPVGTTVKATARVGGDQGISIDLKIDDNRIKPEPREEPKVNRAPPPSPVEPELSRIESDDAPKAKNRPKGIDPVPDEPKGKNRPGELNKFDRGMQPGAGFQGGGFPGGRKVQDDVVDPSFVAFENGSLNTKLTLSSGKPVIAQAVRISGKGGSETTLVIVTARVADSGAKVGR